TELKEELNMEDETKKEEITYNTLKLKKKVYVNNKISDDYVSNFDSTKAMMKKREIKEVAED
ncbi:MAG: hypothetical protein K6B64_02705, partial [Acholeplasmatales bacterium]|nr:hypothetical protein [Acholeplasmatales bacterium]